MVESDLCNGFHYQGLECGMEIVISPKLRTTHSFSSHLCFKSLVWFLCLLHHLGFFFLSFQNTGNCVCLLNCTHQPNEVTPHAFSGKGFFWIHGYICDRFLSVV